MKAIDGRRVGRTVTTALFLCYVVPALFFFLPYYNWQYAQENSFFSWVMGGEIVATGKSLVWPYFVFFAEESEEGANLSEEDQESIRHFRDSNKAMASAQKFMREGKKSGDRASYQKLVIERFHVAESEAKSIDVGFLKRVHSELSERYLQGYIPSIEMMRKGYEDQDVEIGRRGVKAFLEYWKWFEANREDFGLGLD